MVFSISDPDDDDTEVDTTGAGGAGTVKKAKPKMAIDLTPKDLLGGIETQEGEECFIETVQSKVNPHEFSQSSDPTASASRGNLGSKILQMNVNKVSTTGSVESQTIKDIPNPIQMKIPYQPTTNSDDGSVTFKPSCKYWDTLTNTWSDKGLVFVGITTDADGNWFLKCNSTHLTDFGIFNVLQVYTPKCSLEINDPACGDANVEDQYPEKIGDQVSNVPTALLYALVFTFLSIVCTLTCYCKVLEQLPEKAAPKSERGSQYEIGADG